MVGAFQTAAVATGLALACPVQADPKEVVVWVTDLTDRQFAHYRETVVGPFNASQGEYQATPVLVSQYDRELKAAIASGRGPDLVFSEGPSYLVQHSKNGLVLPLDPYSEKYRWDQRFIPSMLSLQKVGDKLYGLPDEYESMFLFYNQTLFAKQGWTVPKTAEEFDRLAEAAKAQGITPLAAGNANWKGTNEWFVTAVLNHRAGANNLYAALTGTLPWNAPVFVEAVKLLRDWWTKGYLSQDYSVRTNAQALAAVATGQAAMTLSGSWCVHDLMESFAQSGQEWAWAPIPSFSESVPYPLYEIGIGSTQSISKFSKNPDGAAAFLDFIYQPKIFLAWNEVEPASGQLFPPVALSEGEAASVKLDPRIVEQNRQVLECIRSGAIGYTTWTFWPDRTEQVIIDGLEKVWAGQLSVEDYLQAVNDQFIRDLKGGRVPPIIAPGKAGGSVIETTR